MLARARLEDRVVATAGHTPHRGVAAADRAAAELPDRGTGRRDEAGVEAWSSTVARWNGAATVGRRKHGNPGVGRRGSRTLSANASR